MISAYQELQISYQKKYPYDLGSWLGSISMDAVQVLENKKENYFSLGGWQAASGFFILPEKVILIKAGA